MDSLVQCTTIACIVSNDLVEKYEKKKLNYSTPENICVQSHEIYSVEVAKCAMCALCIP